MSVTKEIQILEINLLPSFLTLHFLMYVKRLPNQHCYSKQYFSSRPRISIHFLSRHVSWRANFGPLFPFFKRTSIGLLIAPSIRSRKMLQDGGLPLSVASVYFMMYLKISVRSPLHSSFCGHKHECDVRTCLSAGHMSTPSSRICM